MEIPGENNAIPLMAKTSGQTGSSPDAPQDGAFRDPRRLWQKASLVAAHLAAVNVKALIFKTPKFIPHLPGQHYDIKLTAKDGYYAERSYSAASAPEEGTLELGVELLQDGEVSPYLWRLTLGGEIEVRGPIGGHFIWNKEMLGPLVLIGGGSGMVPLMSMLRHYDRADGSKRPIIFLISARNMERILYKEELKALTAKYPNLSVVITLTDEAPVDWHGYRRRVDKKMFQEVVGKVRAEMPRTYVCGPTGFVEAAAKLLVALGLPTHTIKTERFG